MIAIAGLMLGGTKLVFDSIVLLQNKALMNEMSRQTLQRAELAADYAVITLSELAASGLAQCDASSLIEIRRTVYLRGAVKDVQVLGEDGQPRCAGVAQAREFHFADFSLTDEHPARNGNIFLDDIGMNGSGLLGVSWRFRSDLTFLAVLNVDSLLFDVFPSQLREDARADLILGGVRTFANFRPDGSAEMPIEDPLHFDTSSPRYPLSTRLTVSAAALSGWNRAGEPYFLTLGGVIGLIIGVLSASVLGRPADPVRELEKALQNHEFIPFMQPVFSIADRRITGCEVLMRWKRPDGELVFPNRFIALAEQSDIIVPMTRSVMRQALEDLGPHLRAHPDFKVAFNITPADLVSEKFATEVCALIKELGIAQRQVVLEVTERQEIVSEDVAINAIKMLRGLGFQVSLDDTGTGHNGLSSVQNLGVDIIKIDKHFINLVGVDKAATTIVEMLVRLARELGMTTVAEGIETEAQLKVLKAAKVDEGQGYLVAKPLPADEFLALVTEPATKSAAA